MRRPWMKSGSKTRSKMSPKPMNGLLCGSRHRPPRPLTRQTGAHAAPLNLLPTHSLEFGRDAVRMIDFGQGLAKRPNVHRYGAVDGRIEPKVAAE